jgi:tryptophan synthase beta subunit
VKVCGVRSPDDLGERPDAAGIVLWPRSPRYLDPRAAAELARALPKGVLRVAVTVDASPRDVPEWADLVQLCGSETADGWQDFRVPILRRVPTTESGESMIHSWRGVATGYVVDHPSSEGGSGQEVDPAFASRLARLAPCLLAGGLDGTNVGRLVELVRPAGVDASSKLESSPGRKDPQRVAAFVRAARAALHRPGRFGDFGGAYAPETLMAPLAELETAWNRSIADLAFRSELALLLHDYAGRPTPLSPARRLSAELGCEVWLKREDLLHTGAHKLNNSLGQCLLAKRMGKRRILAETGAGQHGVATATACALLGLECVVYMGAVDAARQRMNLLRMELLGARVVVVEHGSKTLKDAINEALRAWVADPVESHYVLGSALGPHPFPTIVAGFQEVIGREARAQILDQAGALPDLAVACVGGGSNAIGLFRAFLGDPDVALVGVEAGGEGIASGKHAARFAGGSPGVLHGCYTFLLQDAEGQIAETHSLSAGLDYPAVGPEHADLRDRGRARYESCTDEDALRGFEALARLEGILPALESAHALGWLLRERESLAGKRVLVNLSGRGDKDLETIAALRRVPRET